MRGEEATADLQPRTKVTWGDTGGRAERSISSLVETGKRNRSTSVASIWGSIGRGEDGRSELNSNGGEEGGRSFST